jgi:hypothetical protein
MQYLAICEDDLLFQFMRNAAREQGEVRYLVKKRAWPDESGAKAARCDMAIYSRRDLQKAQPAPYRSSHCVRA